MKAPLEQTDIETVPARQKPRVGLFTVILSALLLGVASGLFFGEYNGYLKIVGDAYVGLLQMTVLPYIVFSLIANIGRLSFGESKRLAAAALAVMSVLWLVGAITIVLASFAFPHWQTGSFFSTSLLEPASKVDLLALFIPSNPFYSLANNLAPAVVVFCILFGIALMQVESKEDLLRSFDLVDATLSRVTRIIVRLSPIGIFAIAASASGTLTLQEFGRLQIYLIVFVCSVLLLTLWVLPMLVASCTPFRYRDILLACRSALLTGFVVGSVFVIIPLLIASIHELLEKYRQEGPQKDSGRTVAHPDFIIPLAYPFPHLGKILSLLFVPFAAWFYGGPMPLGDYPLFLATGLFLSFGKVTTTVPFLLDMQEIPTDIFQLFLMSGVIAGRFNDLLGGMHLFAFTALTTCVMAGLIEVKRSKLLATLAVTLVIGSAMTASAHWVVNTWFKDSFSKEKVLAGMNLLEPRSDAKVLDGSTANPVALRPGQPLLERIRERGTIRIGFSPDNLPFTYYNEQGQLVGFDIDIAHRLARDLGVSIEFVPFASANLVEQLAADHFDIAASGIAATPGRAETMVMSDAYTEVSMAFVIRDHHWRRFETLESIRRLPDLSVGVEIDSLFASKFRDTFPNARIVELWSSSQFFEGPPEYMDALLTTAEGGSAWTLLHPEYRVINPFPQPIEVSLVFALAGDDDQFEQFLKHWIESQRNSGTIQELYDYWIIGKGAEADGPRWSVIRNVLQWVD